MGDEVLAGPRIAGEELGRQKVAFQSIAQAAGQHDVPRRVSAAVRERVYVVERRYIKIELRAAVHAATAAVAHRRSLEGALLMA